MLEYLLPKSFNVGDTAIVIGKYHDQITHGIIVTGLMTLGLGIINIFMTHGVAVIKQKKNWINSLALLASFLITAFFLVADFVTAEQKNNLTVRLDNFSLYTETVLRDYTEKQVPPIPRFQALIAELEHLDLSYFENAKSEQNMPAFTSLLDALDKSIFETEFLIKELQYEEAAQSAAGSSNVTAQKETLLAALKDLSAEATQLANLSYENSSGKKTSSFIQNSFFIPLGSAMFSLLAFYIVTAAYRTFRIKSIEALAIMIPALLIMLGQIPHGPAYIYSGLPDIRTWLLKNLSSPAFRAIFFGSAIAGLAMAVRMWLSLEKTPLAEDTEEGK